MRRWSRASVALAGHAGKTVHVLVRPDSPIRSVADLRGRKIATGIGSSTDEVFRTRVASKFGLGEGGYEPVNTLEPDKVAALVARQVEASVSTEPFISVAEEQGLARSLLSFEAYDPMPVVLAAGRDVLDEIWRERRRLAGPLALIGLIGLALDLGMRRLEKLKSVRWGFRDEY